MRRKTQTDVQPLDTDLNVLVARARATRRLPDAVRARVLARARASLATLAAAPAQGGTRLHTRAMQVVLAVSFVLAAGAAGAAVGAAATLLDPTHGAAAGPASQQTPVSQRE
jgi:hypothetical protein